MPSAAEERSITIDAGQRSWLRRHAPKALGERDRSWFIEQWLFAGELLAVALTGLFGLLVLGWSAEAGLACLLLGMLARTAGDLLKMLIAGRAVHAMARNWSHLNRVWVITRALSRSENSYPASHASRWNPGAALGLDVFLGTIGASLLAYAGGIAEPDAWVALAADPMWIELTALMLLSQLGSALWTALQHAGPPQSGQTISFSAGMRGLGLFTMAILVLLIGGDQLGAWWTLLAMQLGLLIIGSSALWGVWLSIDETRYLRAWLELDQRFRHLDAQQADG